MHKIYHSCLLFLLALGLYLGSFRGYVALWEEDKTDPRVIYPYKVTSLPPADQRALELGIPVRSDRELARLLEDFLS